MKTFTIGLNTAGNIHFVMSIPAKTFEAAFASWAHFTGHNDPLLNYKKHTYFGWPIVETKATALERKSNPNPFQY